MAYTTTDLGVAASVAASTPVAVSPRSPLTIGLTGTFVGTVQLQWSPDKTGAIWYPIGSALTAAGLVRFPAGRAHRIRANTSAYTSGTPVGTMLHDTALSAHDLERTFATSVVAAPAEVAAGAATDIAEGSQGLFSISGTFNATLQPQISLSKTGSDWHNWGPAFTAPGQFAIARGIAARFRLNTTAYVSGTPVATLSHGLAVEPMLEEWIPTVTSGAISLLTRHVDLSVTGTKAYTIADGLYVGQRISGCCTVAATTPDGTVTPANFVDGTNIDIDDVGESFELEWTAAGWKAIYISGGAIA